MILEKLKKNEVVLGLHCMYPEPGIIECIGKGWDWVWIDGQHGELDYRSILNIVRVSELIGLDSIVRVAGHEEGIIAPILDLAPAGVMIPMVNTGKQAQHLVEICRFPPKGCRSFTGRRIVDLYGRDCFHQVEKMLIVLQIETPAGLENVEKIASVGGVNSVFFGADDLKLRLGIPIDTPLTGSKQLQKAAKKIAKAAQKAGIFAGAGAFDPKSLQLLRDYGYRLIVGGGDKVFLFSASTSQLKELRKVLGQEKNNR